MTALVSNLPNGRKQYFDTNGNPLVAGSVAFFIPNTSTLSTVYQDDQKSVISPNPVTLDAAGTCSVFASGEFREQVKDADGNLISDSVVVAPTPLIISDAMLPVLTAATPADAEAILNPGGNGSGGSSGGGSIGSTLTNLTVNGDQTLNVAPIANPPATFASLSATGNAVSANTREFLVNLGLTSAIGLGGTAGNDKVTLYSGLQAKPGTGDTWTFNTCLNIDSGAEGKANHTGIEVDVNNGGASQGNSGTLVTDFGSKVINGISISGAGPGSCTVGCIVNSAKTTGDPQWSRGFTTVGRFGVCGYQEWGTTPVGFQFDGAYSTAAINMTAIHNNAGAVTDTALLMKPAQHITWQDAQGNGVVSNFLDQNNNMFIGLGSSPGIVGGVFMGGTTVPQADNAYGLGTSTNRWTGGWFTGDVNCANVRLPNASVLSWSNNPDSNGGIAGLVFDWVDSSNNRIIGNSANNIYMGAAVLPQTPGSNLGNDLNFWGSVYSQAGVVTPSDPKLKKDMVPLYDMGGILDAITPIAFKWKAGDDRLHFGFNAEEVRTIFGSRHAISEVAEDGTLLLQKDHMLAVLWRVCKDLKQKVSNLERFNRV